MFVCNIKYGDEKFPQTSWLTFYWPYLWLGCLPNMTIKNIFNYRYIIRPNMRLYTKLSMLRWWIFVGASFLIHSKNFEYQYELQNINFNKEDTWTIASHKLLVWFNFIHFSNHNEHDIHVIFDLKKKLVIFTITTIYQALL